MITEIDIDIDYVKISKTYKALNVDNLITPSLKQLSIQCRPDCSSNNQLYESCGSLFYDWSAYDKNPNGKLPLRKTIYKQSDFSVVCDLFKNTYFETVISNIQTQYNIVRGRFMRMEHKTCLTYHKDQTKRIHIPVYTNNDCMMIIDDKVCRIPFGSTYLVDTTLPHTALNASKDPRVHLVFCVNTV